jgi:hypothetical protein
MGRVRSKRREARIEGRFVALTLQLLDSAGYLGLSYIARALLIEVARQYHGDDNGRMLLSRSYLATRGWYSADAIQRAKKELLAAGFIFQTVTGMRPNKASWYAVTWRSLDKLPGYDVGVEDAFVRHAYLKTLAKGKRPPPPAPTRKRELLKNAGLIPAAGTADTKIVPASGTERATPVPAPGAIREANGLSLVPPPGHPLEVAISRAPAMEAQPPKLRRILAVGGRA